MSNVNRVATEAKVVVLNVTCNVSTCEAIKIMTITILVSTIGGLNAICHSLPINYWAK